MSNPIIQKKCPSNQLTIRLFHINVSFIFKYILLLSYYLRFFFFGTKHLANILILVSKSL